MKTFKGILFAAVMTVAAMCAAPLAAQTASIHGKVINDAGFPLTTGSVQLTKDKSEARKDQKMGYTFPIGADATYKGEGIAPGDYFAYVIVDGKDVDRLEVALKAGDDKTLDFDMTREEYQKALTPERRKEIEEYKKRNGDVANANKVISNLNATLKAVRDDMHSATPNFDKDESDMRAAVQAKPDESILYISLADVLSGKADHLAADDKKAGKPAMSDPEVVKNYDEAVADYKKGIDLNAASKKPRVEDQAISYSQMGNTLAREGKVDEAREAYEKAGTLVPASAGMYYNNEAAVLYNASQQNPALNDGVLAAAEKAIAADPNRPDPYYIKAQMLLQKATLDPKTQKLSTPPGCIDAYQHYLSLAPDGKYAASVKEVLASLGEKIDTHYRAGKK